MKAQICRRNDKCGRACHVIKMNKETKELRTLKHNRNIRREKKIGLIAILFINHIQYCQAIDTGLIFYLQLYIYALNIIYIVC